MRTSRFWAAILLLTAAAAFAQDNATEPYSIEFIGADGKPIPDAAFYLYELSQGQFKQALYRGHKLGPTAKIELQELPMEFMIGVNDRENFYSQFWHLGQIKIQPGRNVVPVKKTGVVSIEFGFVDPNIKNPLVVPYYRRGPNGYEHAGGIGIFLDKGRPFEITGLEPGDYRFELKQDYQSPTSYWQMVDIPVKAGALTKLHDQATTAGN